MTENNSGYGWCQSCGALVFNSPQCHKCGGKVKPFCVDITLVQQAERIKELEAELEKHRWIPVSESLPKEGKCLVLCEGKIYEIKVRISEDEWEDNKGKIFMQETAYCDIRGLGAILIGHDECITHWKPIILP